MDEELRKKLEHWLDIEWQANQSGWQQAMREMGRTRAGREKGTHDGIGAWSYWNGIRVQIDIEATSLQELAKAFGIELTSRQQLYAAA